MGQQACERSRCGCRAEKACQVQGAWLLTPGPARVQSHHGGMGSGTNAANGGDSAALRALVERLPDLSYMLSDSLVVPTKGQ